MLKYVKGFEGLYRVNELGEVFNRRGRKRKATLNKKLGYLYLPLRKDGQTINMYIHRVIAEAFIPNPENKPQVNHINGDKQDNRIENLEWVTPQQNVQHAHATGLCTPYYTPVEALTPNGQHVETFPSIAAAAAHCGANCGGNICKVIRHQRRTACGYIWRYV